MSLAEGNLRLLKFVPDEFVVHLPRYPVCDLAPSGPAQALVKAQAPCPATRII